MKENEEGKMIDKEMLNEKKIKIDEGNEKSILMIEGEELKIVYYKEKNENCDGESKKEK
jgi:hypothetical protein